MRREGMSETLSESIAEAARDALGGPIYLP